MLRQRSSKRVQLPTDSPHGSSGRRDTMRRKAKAYPVRSHNNKIKLTTREIAALDFLLHIPMANEAHIRQTGYNQMEGGRPSMGLEDRGSGVGTPRDILLANKMPMDEKLMQAPGRKLDGIPASLVRVPPQMRYRMLRMPEQSAMQRQWEAKVLEGPVLASRMFISQSRGYPVCVSSVVKYAPEEERLKRQRQQHGDELVQEVFNLPQRDWRGFSYAQLLKPQLQQEDDVGEIAYLYDPDIVDDPEMTSGKHRYLMVGEKSTGPVISSVILFVRPNELKDSLNEKFHEKHPQLPPSFTLSKYRSLKKAAMVACVSLNLEVSTIAYACIYFEQLCLKGLVAKANRRLVMAVCLVLAFKFNEVIRLHNPADETPRLHHLLEYLDRTWSISKKQIFDAEFGAFVHLKFGMHVPYQHLYTIFTRLLKMLNTTPREYLSESMLEEYTDSVVAIKQLDDQIRAAREKQMRNSQKSDVDNDNGEGIANGKDGSGEEDSGAEGGKKSGRTTKESERKLRRPAASRLGKVIATLKLPRTRRTQEESSGPAIELEMMENTRDSNSNVNAESAEEKRSQTQQQPPQQTMWRSKQGSIRSLGGQSDQSRSSLEHSISSTTLESAALLPETHQPAGEEMSRPRVPSMNRWLRKMGGTQPRSATELSLLGDERDSYADAESVSSKQRDG